MYLTIIQIWVRVIYLIKNSRRHISLITHFNKLKFFFFRASCLLLFAYSFGLCTLTLTHTNVKHFYYFRVLKPIFVFKTISASFLFFFWTFFLLKKAPNYLNKKKKKIIYKPRRQSLKSPDAVFFYLKRRRKLWRTFKDTQF